MLEEQHEHQDQHEDEHHNGSLGQASLGQASLGQALPLGAGLLWLVAGLGLLLVMLASTAADRSRAQNAADAAALGAAGSRQGAQVLAQANGGQVIGFQADGSGPGSTYVRVQVGDATAHASAIRGNPQWDNLHPRTQAALRRAELLLNTDIPIVSGFRSRAEQQALWDVRHLNPYPVARPGTSRHETGLAVDIPASFAPLLASIQAESGLCQVLPVSDPIHFEPCQMTPTP